ncbi:MAG: metallophosphoesterase [Planctomycetota bacterium]
MRSASLNLQDADAVVAALEAGAEANRAASCRDGSIDRVEAPGRLIATGDLHDNPIHFQRLVEVAGLTPDAPDADRRHLTLHEVIHSDRLMNGMDFSYRALTRVAALKADFPEHVHTLLANHELSQIVGAGIIKDGVRVVEAFNDAVAYAFENDADRVNAAIETFVRSMPLALRCVTPRGDVLCAHSVPGLTAMNRFDATVLSRSLTDEDYEPRRGSAYLMVWGRGYDDEQLEDLVERWGVNLFILGHEHAPSGVTLVPPNAIVLNSDHERGVYLPIDLDALPSASEALAGVVPLQG